MGEGKIARFLAGKASIAVRIDHFNGVPWGELEINQINNEIDSIKKGFLSHEKGSEKLSRRSESWDGGERADRYGLKCSQGTSVRVEEERRRQDRVGFGIQQIKGCCFNMRTKQDQEGYTKSGSTCLYLGASGGTVSHIHDIVCGSGNHLSGLVVAVEISPRMIVT